MTPPRYQVLLIGAMSKPYVAEAVTSAQAWLPSMADSRICDLSPATEGETWSGDLALVFGGDGAMLAAARRVAESGTPLLGVNMGRLGFMAEITPSRLQECLASVIARRPAPVERMMIEGAVIRNGAETARVRAVNDIVLSREAHSRLIELKLFINGDEVTTYAADGIIISTPVGSTAHSLAAGGPVLHPDLQDMVISPICPHTLSNRPLVVSGGDVLEIETFSRSVGYALTADGQVFHELRNADRVRIARSPVSLKLIRATDMTFYETLRAKLQWGGRPYYGKD
ncbi:MAG TPA: NAD(+)/NADH kinase [Candidatus Brocadiia bacterium]|nr:NAD(+)/NADH kinase [Candidatus Brocadiia bacterium]